jgi:formylglycine-generating enzyme required for sulfatase activity
MLGVHHTRRGATMDRSLLLACLLPWLAACPPPAEDSAPAGDSDTTLDTDDSAPPGLWIEAGPMLSVPAGSFTMGGPGEESKALPEHQVTLSRGYALGRAEVTNAQFAAMLNIALERGLLAGEYQDNVAVSNAEGSSRELMILDGEGGQGDNRCRVAFDGERFVVQEGWEEHPANWVTWFGAALFCNLLSEQEGLEPLYDTSDWSGISYGARGYRLPTEAEWERAARYDDDRPWPWGDSPEPDASLANYDFAQDHTAAVCSLPAGHSALGLCDMAGNVLEWTQDRHHDYGPEPIADPVGVNDDGRRVIRGGSWNHEVDRLLSWDRYYDPLPSEAYGGIGFRLALVEE